MRPRWDQSSLAVAVAGLSVHDPAGVKLARVPQFQKGSGPMRLLAVAEISRGRLGSRSVFDEIPVHVEPKAALTTIDFETDKPLQLGRSGQSSPWTRGFDGQNLRASRGRRLCRRSHPAHQRALDGDKS